MRLTRAPLVAALVLGTAACASSPSAAPVLAPSSVASSPVAATPGPSRPSVAATGTPSATSCGWGVGPETDLPEYRGMTLAAAKERAASEGLVVRDQGADGECFPVTQDYWESGRINFYSERGIVVWAQLY